MPMPEWRFDNFALSPKVAKTKPQGQMVPRPLNPPPSSPDAASGVGKARIRPKFDFGPMSASKRSRPTKSMSPSGPGSKDGDEVTVLDATTIDDPRPIVPRDPGRISSTTSVSVPKSRPISKDCPMSFDFSGDSKLTNIKRKMLSIIDPEGKNTEAISSHVDLTVRRHVAIENAGGHKQQQKKFKPGGRFGGAPSIATWNDFKSAGGGTVAKEVRKVVNENSDDSQGGNNDYPPSRYLGNKKISSTTTTVSGTTCGFVPPTLGRKGMEGMGAKFDSKEEKVTGLRAEPSLKNFDENIINLIESEIMSVTRETGWSDVAGLEAAKKALREIVVLPFKRPDVFKGIRAPPKGVLLFGPPGTGKTMIGRCVASQCKATFFNISASSLTSKWVGEGEKLVRALFAVARVKLPSVIFIDEIDSLLSSRSESEHESSRRIKTEFLVQLDGVATSSEERLLVLGATNRPQELDEAARRRFAKRLYIALPEGSARMEIVRSLLKDMDHKVGDAELGEVGRLTEGYSGADMRQMCAEASMGPIRDVDNSSTMDIETVNVDEIRPIMIQDFRDAARVVRPTVVAEDLRTYLEWDQKFGCLL